MEDPGDPDLAQETLVSTDVKTGGSTISSQVDESLRDESKAKDNTESFPEPVPAISSTNITTNSSSDHLTETSYHTLIPPEPPSISGKPPPLINEPPDRGEIYTASLGLANKHPVSAVYEYSKRMKYANPWFAERWGPGGGWAFDVTLGPKTYSSPWFKPKKRDAKMEACKYALQQIGIFSTFSG